ncbi:MAG TPA: hypothetical protein VF989_17835, partial [Polyangiaceae bacterium]
MVLSIRESRNLLVVAGEWARLDFETFRSQAPRFFAGFELMDGNGVKLATPEKALVDTLYLAPARSRLFCALPELEL